MKRPNVLDWRPDVVVASPDETVQVRYGDGGIETFAVPYGVPMIGALPPGTKPSFAGGEFLNYLPGHQFLSQYYLPRRFGQVGRVQALDLPDLAQSAFQQQPPPLPMQGRADAGLVRFEVGRGGGVFVGQFLATTHFTAPPPALGGAGNWSVGLLAGYLCRPDREALAQAVMGEMVRGYRLDVQWYARQMQIDISNAQQVAAGVEELGRIGAETNRRRAAGMEAAQAPLTQAAAGLADYRDDQGRTYRVPVTGAQNYYLVNRTGAVVTTDAELPPYDFTLLTPTR
jgi:hypothetical protein